MEVAFGALKVDTNDLIINLLIYDATEIMLILIKTRTEKVGIFCNKGLLMKEMLLAVKAYSAPHTLGIGRCAACKTSIHCIAVSACAIYICVRVQIMCTLLDDNSHPCLL